MFSVAARRLRVRAVRAFLCSAVFSVSLHAALTQRWSFNAPAGGIARDTVLTDTISGTPLVVRGVGASFDGAALTLPGATNGNQPPATISAYLDLPNGILSSRTDITIELWAAPLSSRTFQRLVDFGSSSAGDSLGAPGEWTGLGSSVPNNAIASDEFGLSLNVGDNLDAQRLYGRLDYDQPSGQNHYIDSAVATTIGQRYHYVITYAAGVGVHAATGGRLAWYRDGARIAVLDLPHPLSAMDDVNNWIGRSQFSVDPLAHVRIDELRLYDHALSEPEIIANLEAGPDAIGTPPPPPEPDHLWVFNDPAASPVESGRVFPDLIGDLPATLRGNGAALTGTSLRLPGTTNGNQTAANISAYLDLPNGLLSAQSAITIEAWATPLSSKNWQRLFDFGRCATTHGPGAATGEIIDTTTPPGNTSGHDNISLSLNTGTNLNSQQLEGQFGGGSAIFQSTTAITVPGTEYHYALVIEDGAGVHGASGCRVRWYRDGVLQNSMDFAFRVQDIQDVNNWIGRSMYSSDHNAHLALNELRVYRRALSHAEIVASLAAGADPNSGPLEPLPPPPVPTSRWSFNNLPGPVAMGTVLTDTSGREVLSVLGQGATFTGGAIVLPGTSNGNQNSANISAYIDLRDGLVSENPSLTFEIWLTPLSSKNWQRIFDFGSSSLTSGPGASPGEIVDGPAAPGNFVAHDNLFLSLNQNNTLGAQRLAAKIGGGDETGLNTDLSSATSVGTEYHYVLSVEDRAGAYGATGCRVRWYRDGEPQGSVDLPYRLADLNDVNNWIGRSQWAADSNSNIAINELRFYPRALSPRQILASHQAGPAATFGAPTTEPDTITIHPNQKALVDVLANDSGAPIPSTLQIETPPAIGTAVVRDGKILYTHDGSAGGAPVTFSYRVGNVSGSTAVGTVTVNVTTALRIDNPVLAMPAEPPPSVYQVADALPGLAFREPLAIATQPGDNRRLYVCERMATIQLVPDVTAAAPIKKPFLDLRQVVAGRTPAESIENGAFYENGLLGLALHPQYPINGYFYVAYTVRIAGVDYQRISRFGVSTHDPDVADPTSELVLLQQLDEGDNHNGGDLHFGPDGYLYYAAGDEENPNDFRQNSQRLDKDFHAGIFRIDVDKRPGNLEPTAHPAIPTDGGVARFSVPIDNPFVPVALGGTWDGDWNGVPISDPSKLRMEFWATGLRHPWRMSFDPLTGDLWAGDVGQNNYEEINLIVRGGNYGWVWREGFTDTTFASNPPRPENFTSIDPVFAYPHGSLPGADPQFSGSSVVGGIVYRGTRFSGLHGHYLFCDSVSGHIWARDPQSGGVTRLTGVPGAYGGLVSMGVDPANQDPLFVDYLNGRILRLVTGDATTSFPATLSATGLFADLADLSPSPGLLPYEPNLAFWSDHAVKRRWLAIPNAGDAMTWRRDDNWSFPAGMVLVKHFDLELTRGDPATKRRLETRVLVKTDDGAYGVSYRWNDAQTDATLVPDEGVEFDLTINDNGLLRTQRWAIPSRSSCLTCHTPQAGGPLSLTTRQLNRVAEINGVVGNQLALLHEAGYFHNTIDDPRTLPRHVRPDEALYSVEARARSYLAVNCAYCHRDDGTVSGANWDGREHLTLAQTNLINGLANNHSGDPANRLVVPGDLARSIIYNRITVSNGFTRMPPLATSELDHVNGELIAAWIAQLGERPDYAAWRLATFGSATSPDGDETADPDGDGQDNRAEFIAFTDPLDAGSFLRIDIATEPDGSRLTLTFPLPPDRHWWIETSHDLVDWQKWAADGADGLPRAEASLVTLHASLSPQDTRRFFRLILANP